MTQWSELSLDELGRFASGKPIKPGREGPYLAHGSNGVIGGSPEAMYGSGVIIGRVGAHCGSVAISREPFWASDNTIVVQPAVRSDLNFLYYLLHAARLNRYAGGSAQPLVTQRTLKALRFRVPEPGERSRIGSFLRMFDDLIENNRRRVEALEEMAQAIYREWFVRFRYPGHVDVTSIDSPHGPVPDGWTIRPFSEIASFVNGFAFKPAHWSTEGRPIIKIKQLKEGVAADTPRCNEAEIDEKFWVQRGALLFSWSAHLGVYRWAEEPGLLNQHLFAVMPTGDLSVAFLHHALDQAIPQFWARAQGTTMRHIKRAALTEVGTVVPPADLIHRFTEAVEPMAQAAIALNQSSKNLAAIRDFVLPRLVTGRIDVSSLDLEALVEEAVT